MLSDEDTVHYSMEEEEGPPREVQSTSPGPLERAASKKKRRRRRKRRKEVQTR